jgi:sulfonate dioxygenase
MPHSALARCRPQDFADQSNDWFRQWTSYFGRPHIHPTSAHPKDIPEIRA